MELYADSWYGEKRSAEVALDEAVMLGARPVGLIENALGAWGMLYWSERQCSGTTKSTSRTLLRTGAFK
jgi:hypothetical protein